MNTTKKGAKLEIYVEKLLNDYGYPRVRRNVLYEKKIILSPGKKPTRIEAQVDVEYWDLIGRKTIVECKYYDGDVGQQEVIEFFAKSKIVDHNSAMMVTNSTYTDAARRMAKKLGIKLVDREGLMKMDYERLGIIGMIKADLGKRPSLEEQLRNVDTRGYNDHKYSTQYSLFN